MTSDFEIKFHRTKFFVYILKKLLFKIVKYLIIRKI